MILTLCARPAAAQSVQEITGVLWLTNTPATSNALAIASGLASTTREWHTNVTAASTQIAVTNTIAWARSNLYAQLIAYPVYTAGGVSSPLNILYNSTNTACLTFIAPSGTNLTLTVVSNWAFVTYSTNTYARAVPIVTATNAMSASARSNAPNALAQLLSVPYATDAISTNAVTLSNYLSKGASPIQKVSGPVHFDGALSATNANLTNLVAARGSLTNFTSIETTNLIGRAGYLSNFIAHTLTVTNLNAPGTGASSQRIGQGSTAAGAESLAFGVGAYANSNQSVAIGYSAGGNSPFGITIGWNALGEGGDGQTVVGPAAESTAGWSTVIGYGAIGGGLFSSALGYSAQGNHSNSTAVGANTVTTTTNQVRLGTAAEHVSIPGELRASNTVSDRVLTTNLTALSASIFSGSITGAVLQATNLQALSANISTGLVQHSVFSNVAFGPYATNTFKPGSDVAFEKSTIATIANGHNSVTIGTNIYVKFTGSPTAPWTLGSMGGGNREGKFVLIENATGQSMGILDESGTAVTASERIRTLTGQTVWSSSDNIALFIYDSTAARWKLAGTSDAITSTNTGTAGYVLTTDGSGNAYWAVVSSAAGNTNSTLSIWTNGVALHNLATNINWTHGVTGYVSGASVFLGVSSSGSGSTNNTVMANGHERIGSGVVTNGFQIGGALEASSLVVTNGTDLLGTLDVAGFTTVEGMTSNTNFTGRGTNELRYLKLAGGVPAGSILRTDSNTNVVAATIGANLSFDGTTLSATGGAASTNNPAQAIGQLTTTNVSLQTWTNLGSANVTTWQPFSGASGNGAFAVYSPQNASNATVTITNPPAVNSLASYPFQVDVFPAGATDIRFQVSSGNLFWRQGPFFQSGVTNSYVFYFDGTNVIGSSLQLPITGGANSATVLSNAPTIYNPTILGSTLQWSGGSQALSNLTGLASTVFTNVPLGGTNISVRTSGGTNFIDTTGELNNWAQFTTNTWNSRQGGSAVLTNLANTSLDFQPGNVITNIGGLKGLVWTNYVQTVSNFVFSFNTNYVELKNQTNVVFTNIVEEATAIRGNVEIHIHNTTGVTMGLVWPSYGAQHGYFFNTNANNAILATTSLASGSHLVASLSCFGTNIFATATTWP